MSALETKNRFAFGLGTIGRDMVYALVSMYLMFYLTDVLQLSDSLILQLTSIIFFARVFDVLNDPFMGLIVDNTKSRWGKYKPWIACGAVLTVIFTILLFTDFDVKGRTFVFLFAFLYVLWGIAWTINDISYWSMISALSIEQKERENIASFARICANIGFFVVVVAIVPVTQKLALMSGNLKSAYQIFAVFLAIVLVFFQLIPLIFVKVPQSPINSIQEKTTVRQMFRVIFKNDQLIWLALSFILFTIGYTVTTGFGQYYFKYVFKNESLYPIFGAFVGIAQLTALTAFPFFSKRFTRKQLYSAATLLVVLSYLLFFFAPLSMIYVGLAGLFLFFGQAFIQLLMLVFLTDTIEYGQLKLGKRNDGITMSLQPFINKTGAALSAGIIGFVIVASGINRAVSVDAVSLTGIFYLKIAMLIFPLISIIMGYCIYMKTYKIDKQFFDEITRQLKSNTL